MASIVLCVSIMNVLLLSETFFTHREKSYHRRLKIDIDGVFTELDRKSISHRWLTMVGQYG